MSTKSRNTHKKRKGKGEKETSRADTHRDSKKQKQISKTGQDTEKTQGMVVAPSRGWMTSRTAVDCTASRVFRMLRLKPSVATSPPCK